MNLRADLALAAPELFLLVAACAVLLTDVMLEVRRLGCLLAQGSLLLLGVLLLSSGLPQEAQLGFHGNFIHDPLGAVLKPAVVLAALLAFVYSFDYLEERGLNRREYYVLGLFAVLGTLVMISAHSFLSLYLGLELLSLALYAMIAIHRDNDAAAEAAMKYFVLGALASGLLLYGISMIYGATGALRFDQVQAALSGGGGNLELALFGLVFVLIGVVFKLGGVPFHAWLPDVYQGAPTAVTLFVATVPKLAAYAMAARVLWYGLPALSGDWSQVLMVIAALSMLIGNVVAIAQGNIKRMLAYSAIAHVGFLLLGFVGGRAEGVAGSMFYILTYVLMSLAGFGLLTLLSRNGREVERLDDVAGLAEHRPWIALLLLVLMFSMAGVPPFAGFWAKWFVIREAVIAGLLPLAVLAVVCSLIGAYYYLRLVKIAYFDPPAGGEPAAPPPLPLAAISANVLALVAIGLLPGSLMRLCLDALPG